MMGRVSRILKAVSEKPKEMPATGLEPLAKSALAPAPAPAPSPPDSADLARIIACWPRMPRHFKETILTLVEVTEGD
jgi:hypothetical protein